MKCTIDLSPNISTMTTMRFTANQAALRFQHKIAMEDANNDHETLIMKRLTKKKEQIQ